MKIRDIYLKYKTSINLQEHMLRSGALAAIILDHWTGIPINKKAIIKACVLHDLAKPMNFNLNKQPQFGMSKLEVGNLRKLQKDLRAKYGKDEHKATVAICKEIGCKPSITRLIENLEWHYVKRLLKSKDMASLIPIYCDMRIGPGGILSLQGRIDDLSRRRNLKNYSQKLKDGKNLEKRIKENVDIDLNSITNAQINSLFNQLRNIEICQL